MENNRFKFRCFDTVNKVMHYFDFSGKNIYAYEGEVNGIILGDLSTVFMYNDKGLNKDLILMQFTGLLDKNGKEIFEGDVIPYEYGDGEIINEVVSYEDGCFWVGDNAFIDIKTDKLKVIGNIHQNPELLK